MSATEQIGVGVVGYGYWGPNLVRNFHLADGANLIGICELDSNRRARAAKTYPQVPLYSRVEDMLRNPLLQAVCLATPVSTHFPLAMKAIRAGKHVLLEKPM